MRNTTTDFKHITERTSASQLKLYDMCPYAFKLRYIDSKKPVYPDPSIFTVGRVIHTVIETYYKFQQPKEEIKESLIRYFHNTWNFGNDHSLFAKGLVCLKNFTDFELLRRKKYDYFPKTELKVKSKGYYGIIDYYDEELNMILDFKTSKRPSIPANYKIQAYVYNLILEGKGKVHFYFLYPNKIRTYTITEEIEEKVKQIKASILCSLKENDFPINDHCRFCAYSHCCDKSSKIVLSI